MHTLEDLGEYQCKFLKIAQILINGHKLSDLDRDALFLSSLPADLETQVHQCLLITKSTHHPSNPYPIADIIEATQFLLTSSALHPLIHSCTSCRCKDDKTAGRTKGVRHTSPGLSKGRGEVRYVTPKGTQGKGGVGRKSRTEG